MIKILLISFDIIREGECDKSYSISSLLAYIKENIGENIEIIHRSFNIIDKDFESKLFNWIDATDFSEYERIAVSNYVWSEYVIRGVLSQISKKFKGLIILGGNQITYSNNLQNDYPECQIFITGFGEYALLKALKLSKKNSFPKTIRERPLLKNLPSPYLKNELIIYDNQRMVRMETKRGCIYTCNFCAHRELHNNSAVKVVDFPLERIFSELDLFNKYNVCKINIIDPIFNYGKQYIDILKYILDINIKSKISLQTKFELIYGKKGEEFLELCSKIDVVLEFGLQTVYEEEGKMIGRSNKLEHISEVIKTLNKKAIDYEVNVIYGLPNQTLNSFRDAIKYLQNLKCKKIIANPLMLLKGTELFYKKNSLKLREEMLDGSHFPIVTASKSFTKSDWTQMHEIANSL
jgi:radical SAM superfamily enzyme YgiQ (UPF0313 family)